MKKIIAALLLFSPIWAMGAARYSGTYTGGQIQLYLPAEREPSGAFTDSAASINSNFTIIGSTLSAIINGTLTAMSTNYARLNGTLQTPATIYVSLSSSTEMQSGRGAIGAPINSTARFEIRGTELDSYVLIAGTNPSTGRYAVIVTTDGRVGFNVAPSNLTNSSLTILTFSPDNRLALNITNEGTGNSMAVADASGDTTIFVIDNAGGITTGDWLRVRGSSTISGVFSAGTDASIASVTFNGLIGNQRGCASGYTRRGFDECYDTDGVGTLIVSSTIAAGMNPVYTTYDISSLNGSNAKVIEIHAICDITNDAVAGDTYVFLNSRVTGGGGAGPGTAAVRRVTASGFTALQDGFGSGTFTMGVNSAQDVDLGVEGSGSYTSATCNVYVTRYWD